MLAAERLHVDDTTAKVLAKTKTRTGRLWVYLRDDRPFGGQGPPAAVFDYSPTRHGEYPRKVLAAWSGVMQADAFAGYNALYAADRKPALLSGRCLGNRRGATEPFFLPFAVRPFVLVANVLRDALPSKPVAGLQSA